MTGCGNSNVDALKDMKVEKYVTLGEYTGISLSIEALEVDNDEWDTLVNNVYQGSITAEAGGIKDRQVAIGDTVNIDYIGTQEGVAFSGGTAEGSLLEIGSGQFIDGFEDGLVGVMPGETVDLNLTFPEAYGNTELAGQAVVFTVTVNFIMPTDLQDDVVASFEADEFGNVEELRQYVYDYLEETNKYTYTTSVENGVLEADRKSVV